MYRIFYTKQLFRKVAQKYYELFRKGYNEVIVKISHKFKKK